MFRFLEKVFLGKVLNSTRVGIKNELISNPNMVYYSAMQIVINGKSKKSQKSRSPFLFRLLIAFFLIAIPSITKAQFVIDNNGCEIGDFGVNASIYAGETDTSAPFGAVDWFKKSTGRGIIKQDPTTVSSISNLLNASGANPSFEVRMNQYLYSKADILSGTEYKVLIDGVWARDNFGGTGALDSSAYVVSSKNAQDPAVWSPGIGNVLGKNDLVDIAGHMYRDFTGVSSDLYFVGLINRAEPGGSAYMDFEFFIEDVGYDKSTFQFNTGGPDLGHTSFQFAPDGEMTRLGDMIYNVTLEGGGTIPGIEVRIWVSRTDYNNFLATPPANLPFRFGPFFDGAGTNSAYGYASIIPLDGAEACGYVNLEGEIVEAPPFGTRNTKSNVFGVSYDAYSITEVGINLTQIGLDNFLVQGNDPCSFAWRTFMVKSRSSASFTSALKDFAGPYKWGYPILEVPTENQVLTCANPQVTLTAIPERDDVTYTWYTSDGNIVGPTDGTSIVVDAPGSYYVDVLLPTNCSVTSDPYVVTLDTETPQLATAVISSITNVCDLVSPDGALTATITGGGAPFTYTLVKIDGETETEISSVSSILVRTNTFTGLAAGTYRVDVVDANQCTISTPEEIITEKTPISFTETITNVLCYGDNNGKIELGVVTGDAPLTYLWNTGNRTKDLVNVAPGTYSVTITDVNGCQSSFTNLVVDGPTQPLSGTISKVDDPGNDGNGSASVSVSGGTAPYLYSWVATGNSTVLGTSSTLSSIGYGSYTVTVTDANSCTKDFAIFVYEAERCFDGIDNNNNGLTDCEDSVCIPAKPTLTGDQNPCVGDEVTYDTELGTGLFEWSYPANVTVISGDGSGALTVTWTSKEPGQICVRSVNKDPDSEAKCVSAWTCISVAPQDKPVKPAVIKVNN